MFTSITSRIPSASVRRRGFFNANLQIATPSRSYGKSIDVKIGSSTLRSYPSYGAGLFFASDKVLIGAGATTGLLIDTSLPLTWGQVTISNTGSNTTSYAQLYSTESSTLSLGSFAGTSQTFRIFNSGAPSASNYERAALGWTSNEFLIRTENGGTGSARAIKLQTGGATRAGVTAVGNVYIGSSAAALGTTATDGFLYIPSCAGVPTGTPTSITGTVPLVADSTNNKLYAYLGGAWAAQGSSFNSLIKGSITVNVGSLAKTAATNITATITGLTTSHSIIVMPDITMVYGVWLQGAAPSATDTVTLRFLNSTGGNITPGNTTFDYIAWIP